MSNPNARRFAIARSMSRRKAAPAAAQSAPLADVMQANQAQSAAPAPTEISFDLQSATLKQGRTRGGQRYASFVEGGQPIVVGFGLVADAMVRDRMARGMAVRERGMLKVVALRSGDSLLDERGDFWRKAA
jgi:hypothetical protein